MSTWGGFLFTRLQRLFPADQIQLALATILGKSSCFLFVGLVTCILSCLTYTLIEKPCMKKIPARMARFIHRTQAVHKCREFHSINQ